jgi:hypothetical protein
VPRANILGFDNEYARKQGLPIGTWITKARFFHGEYFLLRATNADGLASETILPSTFALLDPVANPNE